ncbi:MAG TPA: hypothetical protein VHU92_25870 [Streptosporangiaceae bacterium]|nr:hypothetical protein [Streptosporangiaceae bacterium]
MTVTAVAALGIGLASAPLASSAASAAPASPSSASSAVKVPVFTLPLTEVGQINLGAAAAAEHRAHVATRPQGAAIARAAAASARYREVDNAIRRHAVKAKPRSRPRASSIPLTTHNVKDEYGFSAMGGVQQASTTGGVDLEPPDQGLCAGNGYVMEFINNALAIYDKNGDQLVAPIGSATAFRQPTSDFFSDPRCYYDAATQRWFFQEFIVGSFNSAGQLVTPSTQFEAVSTGPDPTGTYTIYSWNTSDSATKGCPCFGDYDQLGADGNGIYVATDQFGIDSGAYNGAVIYAISKEELETAATTGIVPPVFGYRLTKDPFGQPYVVAPTSTPPGARFATNTEYFVESNSNQPSDDHLVVYALHDTSELGTPAPPAMYRTEVTTESYAFPPDATQKPGVRPLGHSYQDPAGGIQADFNAEMEPVYTGGRIYAQLDTGTASGSDAVDWFILTPALSGSTLSAKIDDQGVVAVAGTSLLYPYTAVNARGHGYLLFSMSGPHNYPSPGYIAYGNTGPEGSVMEATRGAAPNDGFTCYAAFVGPHYGGCRWGDYSQGVVMNGRVYMAAEMIPQGYRDLLSNWGTYIWSAPPPNS